MAERTNSPRIPSSSSVNLLRVPYVKIHRGICDFHCSSCVRAICPYRQLLNWSLSPSTFTLYRGGCAWKPGVGRTNRSSRKFAPFCTASFCLAPFCFAPFCSVRFCSAPFCSATFCSVPFCSTPFCSVTRVALGWALGSTLEILFNFPCSR